MNKLSYIDGTTSMVGDVISWYSYDYDYGSTYKMIGIVKPNCVLYLSGDIDFGLALGKELSFDDVINQSNGNVKQQCGIIKLGDVSDLAQYIKNF